MNIFLLNPFFLIGFAAVALPVIAHLISRKSAVRIDFPAVRFLTAASGMMSARSRLKDLILLVLRALIIVLVVLLFAKPALFTYSDAGGGEPESVAVLVDNSFSMGYGGYFGEAKKRATDVVESLPDGSFAVAAPLVGDGPPSGTVTSDRSKLVDDIRSMKLSASWADNEKVIESLRSLLLNAPTDKKRVIFITDMQKNGWTDPGFNREWLTLIDVTEGEQPANRAVASVANKRSGGSLEVTARVDSFYGDDGGSLLASAFLGGGRITETLDLDGAQSASARFVFPLKADGAGASPDAVDSSGRVEIPPDGLEIDDVRYFTVPRNDESGFLVIDGDPREDARLSESYYLASALETIGEKSGTNVTVKNNESFFDEDLSSYSAVFLANAGDISVSKSKEMEEFVDTGGTLVIFAGDRIRGSSYNALLGGILPAEMGVAVDGDYYMKLPDEESGFEPGVGKLLSSTHASSLFSVTPGPDARVLIETKGGEPVLIERGFGNGSAFLFTTGANTDWSDFPISTVFVPVMSYVLDSSGTGGLKTGSFLVGDAVRIKPGTGSVTVTDPGGGRHDVMESPPVFTSTHVPGVYTVNYGGKPAYEFSVNVDPLESDPEKLPLKTGEEKERQSSRLVKVFREIWPYFLWGAILTFVSESAARAAFSGRKREG